MVESVRKRWPCRIPSCFWLLSVFKGFCRHSSFLDTFWFWPNSQLFIFRLEETCIQVVYKLLIYCNILHNLCTIQCLYIDTLIYCNIWIFAQSSVKSWIELKLSLLLTSNLRFVQIHNTTITLFSDHPVFSFRFLTMLWEKNNFLIIFGDFS